MGEEAAEDARQSAFNWRPARIAEPQALQICVALPHPSSLLHILNNIFALAFTSQPVGGLSICPLALLGARRVDFWLLERAIEQARVAAIAGWRRDFKVGA